MVYGIECLKKIVKKTAMFQYNLRFVKVVLNLI